MNPLLLDLLRHQAWADAELWRAIEAHPPARDDEAIRSRLHHLHLVQRSFTWIADGRRTGFEFSKPEDFATFADLKSFARDSHAGIDRLLAEISEHRLAEIAAIPWFKDPPLSINVGEALAQCAMHSQWHRGQNANRLRELGGTPPTVDLILWYWKSRPAPDWD